MKIKVALFDFCETIVDLQTADEFVFFSIKRSNLFIRCIKYKFLKSTFFFKILRAINADTNVKKKIAMLLKGIPESRISEYAIEFCSCLHQKYTIRQVNEKIDALKAQGYQIWIVSAGYGSYLKMFSQSKVDKVIATELEISSGYFTGQFLTEDCIGEEKVKRVSVINKNGNYDFLVAFSDSESDVPLLKMAHHGVVISKHNCQEWAKKYAFEEIVWDE